MEKRIKCVAAGLDFTLIHFLDPAERGLFNIFRKRGVSESDINAAFTEAMKRRFSIDTIVNLVTVMSGRVFTTSDREEIRAESEKWFESFVSYPDSIPFLQKYWGEIPIAIVTHGDQDFQRKKVYAAHVPYDDLRVVTPPKRKVEVLAELLERYGKPVIFMEDNPHELDNAWHRFGPENVITILVTRNDGVYGEKQPQYEHIKVVSLNEVDLLIERGGWWL